MYTNDKDVPPESSHSASADCSEVMAAMVSKAEHTRASQPRLRVAAKDIFTSTPTDSVMLLHDFDDVQRFVTMMLGQQRLLRSSFLLFRLSSQQQLFQYRTMFGSKKFPPPAVMGDER
jgi:hypothetical protein